MIFLKKKFKDKNEAIEFLVSQLAEKGKINSKDDILSALLEREEINSSGVNDQIAIPHLRRDDVDDFVATLCTLKTGIDFGSLDGEDVMIILILLAPKKQANPYLTLLARFSRIFKKAENRSKILDFTDPVELISFIREQEEA